MENIKNIIVDSKLEYKQKKHQLAVQAENMLPYVKISSRSCSYLKQKVICDVFEGHAPFRPRYILPDYAVYLKKGSAYLDIKPPKDMYEAINSLLIIYEYVPSITGYPVYLGQVDELLEPFVHTVTDAELEKLLRMYLIHIDRTLPDVFVHMNIGPRETKVGRMILKLEKELKKAVPNISLKYSKETSDDFARLAVETALEIGKPYFVNHEAIADLLGEKYGVASCYNTLKISGGSYTMVRLNLKEAAKMALNYEDFMNNRLPDIINALCEIINARASFIVEESNFFDSTFLTREGLLDIENFTSMAGIFGLFECVELLSGGLMIGTDSEADKMAEEIVKKTHSLIKSHHGAYCYGTSEKIGLHAQSCIDTDMDVTAGVRIKTGREPELSKQLKVAGSLQQYFDTGVSDIYIFEGTDRNNTEGLLEIINETMAQGIRIFALNKSDSEMMHITGKLIRRSNAEKYFKGESSRGEKEEWGQQYKPSYTK